METEHVIELIDKKVLISYKGSLEIEGICRGIDGYLNVVLEEAIHRGSGLRLRSCYVRGVSVAHIALLE